VERVGDRVISGAQINHIRSHVHHPNWPGHAR
jgi:hypothetical protein